MASNPTPKMNGMIGPGKKRSVRFLVDIIPNMVTRAPLAVMSADTKTDLVLTEMENATIERAVVPKRNTAFDNMKVWGVIGKNPLPGPCTPFPK